MAPVVSRIPRIIHQIWIGPKPRPVGLMATWQALNPSFKYWLWDNERCARFGFKNARKIDEQPEWNGKADLMRYEILARYGGILVDADSECILSLDDHMLEHDSFACWESEISRPGLIAAGYVGATVGNRLMRLCVDECSRRDMSAARAWITVGPRLLTDVARGYPDLHIYPSWTFIPEHSTGIKYDGNEPVYAKQYWGSTFDSYGELAGMLAPSVSASNADAEPLVSIVIPCFKQAEFLPNAISSVIGQTYSNWECIVVNDGSPDDTSIVASAMARACANKIHLIEKTNGGLSDARNAGIAAAKGGLILPLDADDMIASTFLEKSVSILVKNQKANAVHVALQEFGERGGVWFSDSSPAKLLCQNALPYASLYRRELWERVGGYYCGIPWGCEDWSFWISCLSFGLHIERIRELLFLYRVRSDGMLSNMMRYFDEVAACVRTLHSSFYSAAQIRLDHQTIAHARPETVAIIEQRVARFPELSMPHFWLGLVYERRGDPRAAAEYERSLALDPNHWQAMERIGSRLPSGERLPSRTQTVLLAKEDENVFKQTWWEQNVDTKMPEFRGWIGDHTAESKVFCRKYIASKSYKSILDGGCGVCTEFYGYKSDGYDIAYKGVDATPKLVALAVDREIDVTHAYLESLPQEDASVDVVYIRHILEHLPHYVAAIYEAMRVAAKEVVIVWFIKPGLEELIQHDPSTNLFHNQYRRDSVTAHVKSHPMFKSLEWVDINDKECMLSIRVEDAASQEQATHRPAAQERKKVALLTIATNRYTSFVKPLYESVEKHFLANHDVDIFLFTNQPEKMATELSPIYQDHGRIQIHVVNQAHAAWPEMALRRFHIFQQAELAGYDFLFYVDVDMLFVDTVGDEILGDLVATTHPGYWDKSRSELTYEQRSESLACVSPNEGGQYFAGGFQGGSCTEYCRAMRAISAAIDDDASRGITAVWHDESHWNRYLINNPPTVVLSPSYCYPESYRIPFARRLLALDKDHNAMRKE